MNSDNERVLTRNISQFTKIFIKDNWQRFYFQFVMRTYAKVHAPIFIWSEFFVKEFNCCAGQIVRWTLHSIYCKLDSCPGVVQYPRNKLSHCISLVYSNTRSAAWSS